MLRRLAIVIPLLAGCDVVFGLREPGTDAAVAGDGGDSRDGGGDAGGALAAGGARDAGPPALCSVDTFSGTQDAAWTPMADSACTSGAASVLPCSIGVTSTQLVASLGILAGTVRFTHSPLVFVDGSSVEVEVPDPLPTAGTRAELFVDLGPTQYSLGLEPAPNGASLVMTTYAAGTASLIQSVPYVASQHRIWRIRQAYTAAGGVNAPTVFFEVRASAQGAVAIVGSTTLSAPASSARVELRATRTSTTNDLTATSKYAFDNFTYCPSTAL